MNTIESAIGRWYGILKSMGIPEHNLSGKHTECPLCGGKDRFRWDNKNDSGSYYCSCGAGYGIDLIMKYNNWDFKQAAQEVDKVTGNSEIKPATQKSDPSIRLKKISQMLRPLEENSAVRNYFESRKIINLGCRDLKSVLSLAYYSGGNLIGRYPAMVATVRNKEGKPVTFHVTYLTPEGRKISSSAKKVMPGLETISGSAIRLTQVEEIIGIAEGIENAMSVMITHNQSCWSVLNANCMESFVPPEGVKKVIIYGDNDANYTGQKSAYTLANKLMLKNIDTDVVIPTVAGEDFNDILMRAR